MADAIENPSEKVGSEHGTDFDYFARAIPAPFRILGLRLKPLSLGRYALMRRFGVAFVADGETNAGASDLLLGVLICSMRVDEFMRETNSTTLARDIARWSRSIGASPPWYLCGKIGRVLSATWVGRLWRRRNSFNLVEKIQLFQRYIKEGSEVPKYWDESPGGTASGSHWAHSLEVTLRSEVGWSLEEINEAPLSKAIADYFKYLESQGAIRLMTPEEINMPELTPDQILQFEELAKAMTAQPEEVLGGS